MSWLLTLLVLLIFAGLLYLFKQPKNFTVKRCINTQQPTDVAFNKIRDLPSWKDWSPWLMHEPDANLNYSEGPKEIGGHYSWKGEMIGEGTLTHVAFSAPTQIQQKIEFLKPFKSKAYITWDFTENENGCEICWSMQSKLPFFFRFLTAKMTATIGNDYELGLAMLKGKLEQSSSHPNIIFDGITTLEDQRGLHRRFSGDIEQMKQSLSGLFSEMMEEIKQENLTAEDFPVTIYHQSKPKVNPTWFEVDAFVPISDGPQERTAKLPGGKYFKVTLLGEYEFLKLAWHSAFANLQMKGYKFDWPRVPFEAYENYPTEVDHPNQIKTTIYIPVK